MPIRPSRAVTAIAAATACLLLTSCADEPQVQARPAPVHLDKEPRPSLTDASPSAGLHDRFTELVESRGLSGAAYVVVDREGGVVFEEYVGDFDESRVSLLASESKMVTSGVLLNLADRGLLDLDRPIVEYVDWAEGANPDVTVAQLLSNTSGIAGFHRNGQAPNREALALNGFGGLPFTDDAYDCARDAAITLTDCGTQIMNHRFPAVGTSGDPAKSTMMAGATPGTVFRYGGSPWQLAGAVAESVSGTPWAQLVHETYVEPCGTGSLGYANHWNSTDGRAYPEHVDPDALRQTANPHLEGGVFSTPGDFASLLLMHLRGGECGAGRALSQESVDRAHSDHTAHTGSHYGLGWWVHHEPDGTTRSFVNGLYGSQGFVDLDKGYGAHLVIEGDYSAGVDVSNELMGYVDRAYGDGTGFR